MQRFLTNRDYKSIIQINMKERRGEGTPNFAKLSDTVRVVASEIPGILRMTTICLYPMFRWTLALGLHPIVALKAIMQTGREEEIKRNAQRALSLPWDSPPSSLHIK